MPHILFVDDDPRYIGQFAVRLAAEPTFTFHIATSVSDALQHALKQTVDVAVIDLMVTPAAHQLEGAFQPESAGLCFASQLRKAQPNARTILITGSFLHDLDELKRHSYITDAYYKRDIDPRKIERLIRKFVGDQDATTKSFIVHGHDHRALYELKDYIQNTLRWKEPIVLFQQASTNRALIEKFEQYSNDIDAVFVLATPDDVMGSGVDEMRARQNVIFELGYFMGKMGHRGPVFLLTTSEVALPSDLQGIIYVNIRAGISSAGEALRRELSGYGLL